MAKKGASHHSQASRLAKVEGQIRGVIKMIEEERYCIDIVTQLKAITSALKSVERSVVEQHVDTCVLRAIDAGNSKEKDRHLREITDLLKASCR
ncbi:MAG: metal-sensitive transcriptional regulator [Bdellovibrionaceae bacterium]|jgi:DNA-binding FrmR family transcriptional regulator|nr:metal-sensitive transcriptional regulator [Pseudobdellovibrionaceae bacterium]